MEDMYNQVRSCFANDMDLTDLFDSEAIIWIDWREYDEDVVHYFNDMMDEPIDIKTVSNGKAYGDDIVLQKGDKELQIPYGDEQDRDVTIKYFNDLVKPDYEVRWFTESLGNDTLGFTVLSVRIINKEKTLAEQKENGQIDLKQYMVAKKELQQSKDDFIAAHGPMK
ncbi:MAG: hypothetical protein E7E42_07695 [Veillonella sp.]|nr:hypothetical protein [Veillonella sp.]